jgi:hypothetical protein
MQVSLVPTEYIKLVWPNIHSYMVGAADFTYTHGRFTADDIKNDLLTKQGQQQLWIAFEDKENYYGAVVTEVMQYPQMRALVMHFTGGIKLPRWKKPMLEIIAKVCKR